MPVLVNLDSFLQNLGETFGWNFGTRYEWIGFVLHKWLKWNRNNYFYDIPLNLRKGGWVERMDSRLHTRSDSQFGAKVVNFLRETLCPSQVFQTCVLNSILCCPLELLRVISEDSKKRNLLRSKQVNDFSPLRILHPLTMRVWGFVFVFPMPPSNSQEVSWVS